MPRSLLAVLAASFLISACVPATTVPVGADSAAQVADPGKIDLNTAYLATSDNGFDIPTVPVERVPETFRRQIVAYESDQVPGTIIINPSQRLLYFVLGNNTAIRYGVGVGRAGFEWSGEAVVNDRTTWPTWTPPAEMIDRKPELARYAGGQPGGLTNPLGARALYLTTNGVDYGYRIHGTPDWDSIGTNASAGCIRLINQDVIDLYSRVPEGAKVIVLTSSGEMPTRLALPPHQPDTDTPRRAAAPVAAVAAVAAVEPAMPDLPMAPALDSDLIATPLVTPAAPAVVVPAIAAPATTTTAPAIPAPAAATTPVCVPTAAKPCPPASN